MSLNACGICDQCGHVFPVDKLKNLYGTMLCSHCESNYYHENPEDRDKDYIGGLD